MKGTATSSPIVIDSCGWVEYYADGPKASRYARYIEEATDEWVHTPMVVMYEVYKFIRAKKDEEVAMMAMAHIGDVTDLVKLTDRISILGAELSLAHKLPMADAIILASAQDLGAKLVTSDKHFKGMDGVVFV